MGAWKALGLQNEFYDFFGLNLHPGVSSNIFLTDSPQSRQFQWEARQMSRLLQSNAPHQSGCSPVENPFACFVMFIYLCSYSRVVCLIAVN